MFEPSFLIIGSTNAGTTSLHRYLAMHPDVFMPSIKEPHFYAFADSHPHYNGPGSESFNEEIVCSPAEYSALFESKRQVHAVGEASVMYIYFYKQLIRNLEKYGNDQIKLVAVLRNPVERAFSSYLHLVRDGIETSKTFEEALSKEDERKEMNWMPLFYYRALGLYDGAIESIYDNRGRDSVKIFIYEDFLHDPCRVYGEICEHIGVIAGKCPDFSVKFNPSGKPKNEIVQKLYLYFRQNGFGAGVLKKLIPEHIKQKAIKANLEMPEINKETNDMLCEYFANSIARLSDLLGRDLAEWKTYKAGVI